MSYLESYYQCLIQPPPTDYMEVAKLHKGIILLFKEYIRRMHYWHSKSGAELWNWRGNIALEFDNSLVVPEEMLAEVRKNRYWPESSYIAQHALYWGALLDKYPNTYDEMNPYESIILLFELGEEFKKDQGFVEITRGDYVTMHTINSMSEHTAPFIEVSIEAVRAASI